MSSETQSIKFFLLGDWGKGGNSDTGVGGRAGGGGGGGGGGAGGSKKFYQAAVAKAMASYCSTSSPPVSFVITLGDNFYSSGVTSVSDVSWTYLYSDVYLIYDCLNIPWYPVLGNHDYDGTPQAQVDRYKQYPNGTWIFPAFNYTMKYEIPGGGSVQVVYLDTTTLAPSQTGATSKLSSSVKAALFSSQIRNVKRILDETLQDPPTWLILAGHYPIYSVGDHCDSSELKAYFADYLPYYNVHAYICGHDHISEHLYHEGTHHFVSGAGTMTDGLGNCGSSAADVLWTGTGYAAFSVMEASSSQLNISFIDTSGQTKYTYSLTNPNFPGKKSPVRSPTYVPTRIPDPSSDPTEAPTAVPELMEDTSTTNKLSRSEFFSHLTHPSTAEIGVFSLFMLFIIASAVYVTRGRKRKFPRDESPSQGSSTSSPEHPEDFYLEEGNYTEDSQAEDESSSSPSRSKFIPMIGIPSRSMRERFDHSHSDVFEAEPYSPMIGIPGFVTFSSIGKHFTSKKRGEGDGEILYEAGESHRRAKSTPF